jgi:glycosyltransferase involved in cell wall biosynthesis
MIGESPIRERNVSTVLFVGRLNPVKRIPLLIDAWPSVLRAVPDATLVIAGSGPADYIAELRGRIQGHGIEGSVSLAGFVDARQKEALYGTSAVFVLPSAHENFGVAALEALSRGIPCIVTEEVALSSFIAANRVGAVCSGDAREIAAAIVHLLNDPIARQEYGARAAAAVQETFSVDAVADRLQRLYELAISLHDRRVPKTD